MADQTLKTLHPFLKVNETHTSAGGIVKSYSHDHGSGPVLCMVHGYPQNSFMWRHCIAALKDEISLFIPEVPGYGFSSLPPQNDKRTVGGLIFEALKDVYGADRTVIWCGHDRGARLGHRMVVDHDNGEDLKPRIAAAIFIDIVPTWEQWRSFSSPLASLRYYHWPLLASPMGPVILQTMGGGNLVKMQLDGLPGGNDEGVARFKEHHAVANYCHQFNKPECIAGSCGDYRAAAEVDPQVQEEDQKQGRKVKMPLLVLYSKSSLGAMHDVPAVWRNWVDGTLRCEGLGEGYGHFLPEECPQLVVPLIKDWISQYRN